MKSFYVVFLLTSVVLYRNCLGRENVEHIDVVDMTKPTTWRDLSMFYGAVEKHCWCGMGSIISEARLVSGALLGQKDPFDFHLFRRTCLYRKVCLNCGAPDLGTGIHLEHTGTTGSMHPAVIPSEYLLSRLTIIDVSTLTTLNPSVVLTLDVALQWAALKHDPKEPTLLLFKFGWTEEDNNQINVRTCVCKIPGLSYELAEWIAANLSHVVGVATDTPTFESEQTREFASRTVSNVLGRSGIYMIENVYFRGKMPEQGCMALAMPLKLLNAAYVPARLTAFCPSSKSDLHVVMSLKKEVQSPARLPNSRVYDVNLDEILS